MARTPARVLELLEDVWPRACAAAARERAALEAHAAAAATPVQSIEPWDWRFLAEQVRAAKYDFDDAAVKPYFGLDAMVAAMFDVASSLFGLRFVRRTDVTGYHADVAVFEVRETVAGVDTLVGVFLQDNFSRPSKQGGAWMSELRTQAVVDGARRVPIVVNNNVRRTARAHPRPAQTRITAPCPHLHTRPQNFNRPEAGKPTLLSFDDAVTLFHECAWDVGAQSIPLQRRARRRVRPPPPSPSRSRPRPARASF
jgi:peptidyl-dipeptidase Dcp